MGATTDNGLIHAVTDTGPLLHVFEAGADFLFDQLLRAVCPISVVAELEKHSPGLWNGYAGRGWIHAKELGYAASVQSMAWQQAGLLDRGEADALALAKELGMDLLITDDAAARLMGTSLGLKVRGSLGLILEAARVGLLDRHGAKTALAALRSSSLWLSERVYAEAIRLLEEIPE